MDKDKVFDFYEKMYFKELDEMNVILSRFPILIAGAALIINAYIFLFKFDHFNKLNNSWQIGISLLIAFFMGGLLFCLFKTFKTNYYQTFDSLKILDDKYKEYQITEDQIKERNKKAEDGSQQKEIDANELFEKDLKNKFIICTGKNQELNKSRREWFHNAMFMIWTNLTLCITIPILIILISNWSNTMPDDKDNPPLINIPSETETVSVRNVIPLTEKTHDGFTTERKDNPRPSSEEEKD